MWPVWWISYWGVIIIMISPHWDKLSGTSLLRNKLQRSLFPERNRLNPFEPAKEFDLVP